MRSITGTKGTNKGVLGLVAATVIVGDAGEGDAAAATGLPS